MSRITRKKVVWFSSDSQRINAAGSRAAFAHLPFPNQLLRQVTTLGQPVVCTSPLTICSRGKGGSPPAEEGAPRLQARLTKAHSALFLASLGAQRGLPQEGSKTLSDGSLGSHRWVLNCVRGTCV